MGKGIIPVEKRSFRQNAGLFISARQKIINNFKGKIFVIKNPEPKLESEPEPAVFLHLNQQNNELGNLCINIFLMKFHTMRQMQIVKYLLNILNIKIQHFYQKSYIMQMKLEIRK